MTVHVSAATADRPGPEQPWLTGVLRPAGDLDRRATERLRHALSSLVPAVSMLIIDLGAARLRSRHSVRVLASAADQLERAGGCLLLVCVDDDNRRILARAPRLLVMPDWAPRAAAAAGVSCAVHR